MLLIGLFIIQKPATTDRSGLLYDSRLLNLFPVHECGQATCGHLARLHIT